MIQKKLSWFMFLFLAACMSGCDLCVKSRFENCLDSSSLITPASTMIVSILATETQQVSNTMTPEIASDTPVYTEVPLITEEMIPQCPLKGIPNNSDEDHHINDTLIYQKGFNQGLYSISGISLTSSSLPVSEKGQYLTFGFSPDGKWLAYSPIIDKSSNGNIGINPTIELLSDTKEKLTQNIDIFIFENELQVGHRVIGISGFSHWINNQFIYISLYSQNPDPNTTGKINNLPKVLDPFNGSWHNEFFEQLPNRYNTEAVGLSPDMTRALYVARSGIVLWDLIRGVVIWSDSTIITLNGALIRWSPDSSMAAYMNLFTPQELGQVLIISHDGMRIQKIKDPISVLPDVHILSINWSPNSRYLGLIGRNGVNTNVLIYDSKTSQFIYRCPININEDLIPQLIWSPDSLNVASSIYNSPLTILNIQTGEMVELVQDARAVGWSDRFPSLWP